MVNRSSFVIAIAPYSFADWDCAWIWVGALDVLISGWRKIADRSQGSWISNSCRKALASWMRCFCARLLNCWYSHRLRRGLWSLALSSSNGCGSPNGIVTQKFKTVIMATLVWTCWSIVIRVSAESPVRHQCVLDWLLQSILQTLQWTMLCCPAVSTLTTESMASELMCF